MPSFAHPVVVSPSGSSVLYRIDLESSADGFDEAWLQTQIFRFPASLPAHEIEPQLGPLVPVCMEMGSTNGYIDILYVTPSGQIVLVEVKLWRNNESRRKVVAQILDYAQILTTWTYEDMAREVAKATKRGSEHLMNVAREYCTHHGLSFDEVAFIDNVNHNLRTGDLVLLIVGDGIRSGVESLVGFLNNFGAMRFNLGMIEVGAYKFGESVLLQPRVLTKTQVLVREIKEPASARRRAINEPVAITTEPPNEESRSLESPTASPQGMSEERRLYEREWMPVFWGEYLDRLILDDKSQPVPPRTPRTTNATFPMPPSATYNWLSVYLARTQGLVGMAIVFASGYDRGQEMHDALLADRDVIEREVGARLQWNSHVNGTIRVDWDMPMGDWKNPVVRNYLLEALLAYTNKFVNAFRPRITALLQESGPGHGG